MSFLTGLGRSLKKIWNSPVGKVVTIAAAAYVGAPAIKSAFDAYSSGGTLSGAMDAFGSKAWDQISGAGSAVGSVFGGGDSSMTGGMGAMNPDEYALAQGGKEVSGSSLASNGGINGGGKSGGIVGDAMKWVMSPGGSMITSAALKLAGGALTPNETAMRIEYEEKKRQEELARQRANTAVSGLNFNSIPLTKPQDRITIPPAPVTVTPRHLG